MFTAQANRTDPTHAPEQAAKALLLDADGALLSAVEGALRDRRVTTITAPDGNAGLTQLLDDLLSLDVLVMALDLPGRDARSLARLIRKAGNERDLALVVIAERPTPALRLELRGLGVDAIVDRADGPQAIAAAAIDSVRSRRHVGETELEGWRHAPAAAPLGERSWWAIGRGGMAMVVA